MKRAMWTLSVCLGAQLLCFTPEAVALQAEGGTWFGLSWCAPESGARLGTGDFNGDGRADLFCTDASGTTRIALSNGTEGFSVPTQWLTSWCANTPSVTTRIGAGDFDGDGDSDLYCNDVNGTTWVTLSNGAGGFTSGAIWRTGWCAVNSATRTGTGDFDADGDSDLYCNNDVGTTSVALSNGSSAFTTPSNWQTAWCYNDGTTRFGTGDFDADGDSDIYCNGMYGGVFVGLSNGVNGIAALQTWHADFCPSSASIRFGASDLNGDGKWDAYCTATTSTGGTQAVLSNGSTMGAAQGWFDGNRCSRNSGSTMFSADLDGGGRSDLYCHSTATGTPALAIQAAIYGQAPPTTTNVSTCPWLFDAECGVRVYQIGGAGTPGENFTLYYHQSPFIDNDWVVIRSHLSTGGVVYKKVNVRNCQEQVLTAPYEATGAYVRGSHMYAFHRVSQNNAGPQCAKVNDYWVGRLDLSQNPPVWTDYVCLPANDPMGDSPLPAGDIAVSSNENWIVWTQVSDNTVLEPSVTRVWAYRVTDGAKVELTAAPEEVIQHIAFSPSATDPRTFTYYKQNDAFEPPGSEDLRIINRVGVGRVGTGSDAGMHILTLDPPPNAPSNYWTVPHNGAHAFWMPDGNLSVDVLWNGNNPSDLYDIATFAVAGSSTPWNVPASAQTNRRYVSVDNWNNHFNPTTKLDWFVGDGDHENVYPTSAFTQLGHFLPWGVRFDRLARNWGTKDRSNGNAHMLPTRDGVLVTMMYPEVAGVRHVYLIELPQAIRDRIQ